MSGQINQHDYIHVAIYIDTNSVLFSKLVFLDAINKVL